jgi:hypothetical protein
MAKVPGLGQGTPELKIIREEHPLPNGRSELVAAFEGILKRGGVRKFVIELGQPLRVERYVKFDEVGPDVVVPTDDLYFAVRNAEIEVFSFDKDAHPYNGATSLFYLFDKARSKGLVPKAILINNYEVFYRWLGVSRKVESAYGVDLAFHKEVPEDVLLFVCTKPEEPDVITLTFQTHMEP